MNLQRHLLSRITLAALLCLLVIASYSLHQSHRQAEQNTQQIAESLGKQLESQLLLINAGIGQGNAFPDFEFWKQSGSHPGICLAYASIDSTISRNLCNGSKPFIADWPAVFEAAYLRIFNPGLQAIHPIVINGQRYGTLTVSPSAELEIADAWNKTLSLMQLTGSTVLAVCLLVYLSTRRALRPAQVIVTGLEAMESGNLDCRLPAFELNEWQRIATAINQLADSQQQLLEERQKLVVKLINLQEEERRYLAGELHDEFGQCLAAINAVAATIKQTAAQQCPELMDNADHISRITAHMLNSVRQMLGRLRPAEFDELGLSASLNSLVAGWNTLGNGKIRYQLNIVGDSSAVPEPQAMTLFRITQEGLTNIAKHAAASNVSVNLIINSVTARLTIQDDGIARHLPFSDATGIGLLGIRERITALKGQFRLSIAVPHGLIFEVELPVSTIF